MAFTANWGKLLKPDRQESRILFEIHYMIDDLPIDLGALRLKPK